MIRSTGQSKLGTCVQISQLVERLNVQDQQCFVDSMLKNNHTTAISLFNQIAIEANEEFIQRCQSTAFKLHQSPKYKPFTPNNRLSSLPNNIIIHSGKFLTIQESIILGYIDRTLYIATQYKSFIINRRSSQNDETFCLTAEKFIKIANWNTANDTKSWMKFGVAYCFPSNLSVDISPLFDDCFKLR